MRGPQKGAGPGQADLDLLNGVHDEHVLQVLHGALHPVVEGRRPLGVLQVQLVDGLQLLLCFLWCAGEGRGQSRKAGQGRVGGVEGH